MKKKLEKMEQSFTIVDGKGAHDQNSHRVLVWTIGAVIFVVFACAFFIFLVTREKTPDDWKDYEMKKSIYVAQSIDYSYEDYQQDKQVAEENKAKKPNKDTKETPKDLTKGISNSTKQLANKSNEVLKQASEFTTIDITYNQLIESIINQTKLYNEQIDNHLGFPDSEYNDDYNGVKEYIDNLILSCQENNSAFQTSNGMPLLEQQAEMRFALFENIQYNINNEFTQYHKILNNYMKLGHPILNNIDAISLEYTDASSQQKFDNY